MSSLGCDVDLDLASPTQLCACEPPTDGCSPGQGACEDNDTISWCTEGWTWTTSSCTEICADQSLLLLGCDAVDDAAICLCTNTGTPCDDAPSVCADGQTLSACEAGLWAAVDCTERCAGPGTCDPGAVGGAACVCGP
ncbi:hypothetical protein [Enhygromyxa salina]|uniref:hypothetical protein n=1 Tax=Enhygromyxa salina TaxID=215803 RepID=UPI0011B299F9|nr:hypothetical protein [Enhygromyxa salina]